MGGAAKAPSELRREGDSTAVGKVLGDVAGARPGHPSEPSRIVHVTHTPSNRPVLFVQTLILIVQSGFNWDTQAQSPLTYGKPDVFQLDKYKIIFCLATKLQESGW
jgi:hypothetical protein